MTKTYTAAMIVIGNEILSGRTQDKNIAYIAKELNELGIRLREVRVVADVKDEIIFAINELKRKHDYIFTTGGIGPTHDDITSDAVAAACQVDLEQNKEAVACLEAYYSARSEQLNEARLKMAEIPKGAELIPNSISSAPGYRIENIFVLAGIPNIMQVMFQALKSKLQGGDVVKANELTYYLPESKVAKHLSDVQDAYPNVEIGSYPFKDDNGYGTNVVLRSSHLAALEQATEAIRQKLD